MKSNQSIPHHNTIGLVRHIGMLALSLSIPLIIGAIAGTATSSSVGNWYASLNAPSFNPPSWVFAPVWTILYLVMGYSFYRIWRHTRSKIRTVAMVAYGIQLLLNFCWTFIFFYFKNIEGALAEIVVLWIAIAFMIISFYKIDKFAALLNLPYLLWVTFATALTAAYYLMN